MGFSSDRLRICGTCTVDAAYVSNVAKDLARLSDESHGRENE